MRILLRPRGGDSARRFWGCIFVGFESIPQSIVYNAGGELGG
jgi:hypothetical protein